MYQPVPTFRDRAGPLALVILVHVGIGYALLSLTGAGAEIARQADLEIFDVLMPSPPPEPIPPPPPPKRRRDTRDSPSPEAEGAASPKNIRSKATPVVAPKPVIVLPAPSPVVAAPTPGTGANATTGASNVRGPGTGAGGTGNGTGSGGGGTGTGGGGNGLGEARARLTTPKLSLRDFPPGLYREAPRGGLILMVLRVGADGVPLTCRVTRSFGNAELDAETCRLAVARLRFSPGRDEQGRPVADYFGYGQEFKTRF